MNRTDKILTAIALLLLLLQYAGPGVIAPAVSGPSRVVIVRESGEDTPELARLVNLLRNGPAADYLKTKGHQLDVLDDDSVDEAGRPAVPREWTEGLRLPAVAVLDKSGRLVFREPLPATADETLAWLKRKGL